MKAEIMQRFRGALPVIREWIEQTLAQYEERAVAVSDFGYRGLAKVYPEEFLSRAKVVIVPGSVPVPPLSRLGLPELAEIERMPAAGITYLDTFFIHQHQQSESIFFHESVHVVQWEVLGLEGFLLAYGAGLMQFGYRDCPLEQMAYRLQVDFERGDCTGNVLELIRRETEVIRAELERV